MMKAVLYLLTFDGAGKEKAAGRPVDSIAQDSVACCRRSPPDAGARQDNPVAVQRRPDPAVGSAGPIRISLKLRLRRLLTGRSGLHRSYHRHDRRYERLGSRGLPKPAHLPGRPEATTFRICSCTAGGGIDPMVRCPQPFGNNAAGIAASGARRRRSDIPIRPVSSRRSASVEKSAMLSLSRWIERRDALRPEHQSRLTVHRIGQGPRRLEQLALSLFLLLAVEQKDHRTGKSEQRQQGRHGSAMKWICCFMILVIFPRYSAL